MDGSDIKVVYLCFILYMYKQKIVQYIYINLYSVLEWLE